MPKVYVHIYCVTYLKKRSAVCWQAEIQKVSRIRAPYLMATGYLVAAIECNSFIFHNKAWVRVMMLKRICKMGDTCYLLSGTNYERLA